MSHKAANSMAATILMPQELEHGIVSDLHSDHLKTLVQKTSEGDTEAFGLLYRECAQKIYRYVYVRLGAVVGKKQLAEDITQEVFLRLYNALKTLNFKEGSPMAYMYTIARNMIIDHSRKKKEDILHDEEASMDDFTDGKDSLEEEAQLREMSGHALEAVSSLPDAVQEVIIFTYMNGYSTEEICHITGKNPEAVRKLKSRGLGLLRYTLRTRYERQQQQQ
jgi:RNA polymerase sigma-70 factor, ECF subfamily